MDIKPIRPASRKAFNGEVVALAGLSVSARNELLSRVKSQVDRIALAKWLSGEVRSLPHAPSVYNRYLKQSLKGKYYWIFSHTDRVDRLWEVYPQTKEPLPD